MLGESFSARRGGCVCCERFLPHKFFLDCDKTILLECRDMGREISVRKIKRLLERVEIHGVVYYQNRHYRQSDAVLKHLVELFDDLFHFSYFRYMKMP